MSLNVPEQLGLGEVELQEIDSVWDTVDQAAIDAMKAGFTMPTRPEHQCPHLTQSDLINLNTQQFTMVQVLLEEWQGYAQARMAQLDAIILQCTNQMEMIDVDTKENIRQNVAAKIIKKPPEAAIKDAVKLNPSWRALLLKKQQCQQEYAFVEPTYKSAARTKALLVSSVQKQKADLGRS
jgi:hypothetical protein